VLDLPPAADGGCLASVDRIFWPTFVANPPRGGGGAGGGGGGGGGTKAAGFGHLGKTIGSGFGGVLVFLPIISPFI